MRVRFKTIRVPVHCHLTGNRMSRNIPEARRGRERDYVYIGRIEESYNWVKSRLPLSLATYEARYDVTDTNDVTVTMLHRRP